MTEQAFRRLAQRVVRDGLGMSPEASVLIAADFNIVDAMAEDESHAAPAEEAVASVAGESQEQPAEPPLAELLETLGITRHAAALEAEHVQSGADLALLTRDDCKELGFSIGERNRVADWAARVGPKRRRVSGEWDMGVLVEKVGSLEESV